MTQRIEFAMAVLMMAMGLGILAQLDIPLIVHGGVDRYLGIADLSVFSSAIAAALWLRIRAGI
jgi:hypothetical protein